MKSGTLRLVAAIAVCLGVVQSSAVSGYCATPPLFFTPASTSIPQVMNALANAHHSIHMIMYRMTTPPVIQAMIDAKNRGLDVQVILDANGCANENATTGAYHLLSAAGVNVMKSSTAFDISHAKSFVIDNQTLYIMSANLTQISPTVRDVGYITNDPNLVAFYNELFTTDVQNSANNTMNAPANIPANIVLAPGARPALDTLLKSANHTIRLEVENLIDTVVIADLIAAHQRGVQVQVLLPRCDMTSNELDMPAAKQLAAAGVQIYMMPSPMTAENPYIHQKSIVVDGWTAFLGSENFTSGSMDYSRELGIIITDLPQVKQLIQMFEQDISVSMNYAAASTYVCPASPFPPNTAVDIE